MMMKVLVPAFFSRKDTKTPMYAAIAALLVNVILNYIFAIKLGYGHTGLALASSIAAILSSGILFIILVKDNYIQLSNPLNKFNAAILIASLAVILFLLNSPFNINFDSINFAQRLMYLSLEVGISALLYFGLAKVVLGNRLRELF
jgi:putative peptidoglycan lipid II flippase